MYDNDQGVPFGYAETAKRYRKAAEKGDVLAKV
jgi:TPR repeat protein